MAADEFGNDVGNVDIPLTGFLAYSADDATEGAFPTPEEGGSADLVLAAGYKKVGLLSEDGGFEWALEPDGDPIPFWQEGYQIPSGLANVTLVFTAAENSPITRALRTGKTPDANGYLTIDGGGNPNRYRFVSEEVMRSGRIRRRAAVGQVTAAKEAKSTRGEVLGVEFTITISRAAAFNNEHLGEWDITPVAAPAS